MIKLGDSTKPLAHNDSSMERFPDVVFHFSLTLMRLFKQVKVIILAGHLDETPIHEELFRLSPIISQLLVANSV